MGVLRKKTGKQLMGIIKWEIPNGTGLEVLVQYSQKQRQKRNSKVHSMMLNIPVCFGTLSFQYFQDPLD